MPRSSADEKLLQQTADAIEASEEKCDAADTSVTGTAEIITLSRETIAISLYRLARINRRGSTPEKS